MNGFHVDIHRPQSKQSRAMQQQGLMLAAPPPGSLSPVDRTLLSASEHLSPSHIQYFKRWNSFLNLEEAESQFRGDGGDCGSGVGSSSNSDTEGNNPLDAALRLGSKAWGPCAEDTL